MTTYVPASVQEGLDSARLGRLRKASKIRIETSAGHFRVLTLGDTGFSVAAEDAPQLRGYVDLFEGPTHLFRCLIVAAQEDAGMMHYEFKRITAVSNGPARDFAVETDTPIALIDGPAHPV